jgi:hypothetical protein
MTTPSRPSAERGKCSNFLEKKLTDARLAWFTISVKYEDAKTQIPLQARR